MTEDEARQVELVRAIEGEDREHALLTREDRDQAEAQARAAIGGGSAGRKADERFIVARADFLARRVTTRHPGFAALLKRSRWPGWVALAVPLAALAIGFAANELGNSRRLDLLAVPLLGTLAWNLAVYLWIAGSALRPGHGYDPLSAAYGQAGRLSPSEFDRGSPQSRAAESFRRRWGQLTAPLAAARTGRTLHLGAAMFAAGLIGGIYLRALVIEYRAGWESTFLTPGAVHSLLSVVLGPASKLTGVAIPPVPEIAAMRWTGPAGTPGSGGVNAGPWIHLYTTTIAGLVIVPRLALAAWQAARALRLSQAFPHSGREDFYVRRMLRAAGARPGSARITPYAYRPGEETRRRLSAALRAALGEGAQVRFDEPVDYGAEAGWAAAHPPDPADDYHVLLFTLSATPEVENHGAMAEEIAAAIRASQPGTVLAAVIDESPYRAHFAGQSGLDDRIAGRLAAWRTALAGAGVTPLGLDLSYEPDDAMSQRLESGLLPDAELHR